MSKLEIPKGSAKKIMKLNDEVTNISSDAISLTAKATELFIADLVETCHQIVVSDKRKTIKVDDILLAIAENQQRYEFLNNAFNQRNIFPRYLSGKP